MNELLELRQTLPRALEDALRSALDSPSDTPREPLKVRIEGVEYTIEHGQVFAVAGLKSRGKAALKRRLERRADTGLIFMDQPFGKLEPGTRARMQAELKSLHAEMRTTIVFVTDDCEEALALGDQVVITRGTSMPTDD